MNKIPLILFLIFLTIPFLTGAHGENATTQSNSGVMLMQQIEDSVVGDELHEEMENIMIKILSGKTLSDEEVADVTVFMQEYPGPHGMMMNRLGYSASHTGMHHGLGFSNNGMGLSGFAWGLMWLTPILFWAILILIIVALFKWIKKN
jgi:uncharacterized membrane protein YtjA (UPF0391 family)